MHICLSNSCLAERCSTYTKSDAFSFISLHVVENVKLSFSQLLLVLPFVDNFCRVVPDFVPRCQFGKVVVVRASKFLHANLVLEFVCNFHLLNIFFLLIFSLLRLFFLLLFSDALLHCYFRYFLFTFLNEIFLLIVRQIQKLAYVLRLNTHQECSHFHVEVVKVQCHILWFQFLLQLDNICMVIAKKLAIQLAAYCFQELVKYRPSWTINSPSLPFTEIIE